jgi:hypothetical protein
MWRLASGCGAEIARMGKLVCILAPPDAAAGSGRNMDPMGERRGGMQPNRLGPQTAVDGRPLFAEIHNSRLRPKPFIAAFLRDESAMPTVSRSKEGDV